MLQRVTDIGLNVVGRLARVDRSSRGTGVWEAVRYIGTVDTLHMWPKARIYFGCTSSFHLPFFQESNFRAILSRVCFIN